MQASSFHLPANNFALRTSKRTLRLGCETLGGVHVHPDIIADILASKFFCVMSYDNAVFGINA